MKLSHSSSTPIVGLGETMQYLDINQRNAAGATPLELATSQGNLNVVKYVSVVFITWIPLFFLECLGQIHTCVHMHNTHMIYTHTYTPSTGFYWTMEPVQHFQTAWEDHSNLIDFMEYRSSLRLVAKNK